MIDVWKMSNDEAIASARLLGMETREVSTACGNDLLHYQAELLFKGRTYGAIADYPLHKLARRYIEAAEVHKDD